MTHPEDQNQDISIAVIQNDIGYIKKSIEEINLHLKMIDGNYIRRDEANKLLADADAIHKDHETRIRRVERWGLIAIGALSVIEFLLNYFK